MAGGQRFKGPAWVWPARAERWQKPLIVAVSVLGHAALFSYLGLRSMGLPLSGLIPAPDPVIYVEITPRPLLPGEIARVRQPPDRPQDRAAPALPGFDFTQAAVCAEWRAAHHITGLRPSGL